MANTRLTLDAVHPLQSWLFKVGKVSKTNGSSLVWYLTWFDDLEIEVPAAVEDEMAGWEYIMSDLIWGNTWWAEDTGCFMSMATRASEARLSKPWSFKLPKMSLWNWKNQNCKKRQSKSASEMSWSGRPQNYQKSEGALFFRIFSWENRDNWYLMESSFRSWSVLIVIAFGVTYASLLWMSVAERKKSGTSCQNPWPYGSPVYNPL